jgi:putative transposase
MLSDLKAFIQSNPDARELKRAVAVQMFLNGCKHREIQESLSVSSGFVSKWTALYREQGVPGLKLKHLGSVGYLSSQQRQAVFTWLETQEY